MTQGDLAEQLYVSRQTVSNYETGRSNPDIDMLVKIAEVLETDVNILIFGIPVSPSRKKEHLKFAGAVVLLLVLVVLLWRLSLWEYVWRREMFDMGPLFAIGMLLRPAVYLAGGWTVMQGISVFWGFKRQFGKAFAIIYWGTLILGGLYLLLTVPYCVMSLYASWQMAKASEFSRISYALPDFWQNAVYWLWAKMLLFKFSCLFFFPGLVLWNGRGARPGTPAGSGAGNPGD